MKTQFTWKGYWQPTPTRLRKFGDALLGIFSIASVSSTITDHKNLAIVSLIIGIVGKVLSNFFAEEPVLQEPTDENQTD
jgi:hypothetical protein